MVLRAFATTPADVQAHALGVDVARGVIECLHALLDDLLEILDRHIREVRAQGKVGAIELQDETRVDDSLILTLHQVTYGREVFVLVGVVLVGVKVADVPGRAGGHEGVLVLDAFQRGLEVGDVPLDGAKVLP